MELNREQKRFMKRYFDDNKKSLEFHFSMQSQDGSYREDKINLKFLKMGMYVTGCFAAEYLCSKYFDKFENFLTAHKKDVERITSKEYKLNHCRFIHSKFLKSEDFSKFEILAGIFLEATNDCFDLNYGQIVLDLVPIFKEIFPKFTEPGFDVLSFAQNFKISEYQTVGKTAFFNVQPSVCAEIFAFVTLWITELEYKECYALDATQISSNIIPLMMSYTLAKTNFNYSLYPLMEILDWDLSFKKQDFCSYSNFKQIKTVGDIQALYVNIIENDKVEATDLFECVSSMCVMLGIPFDAEIPKNYRNMLSKMLDGVCDTTSSVHEHIRFATLCTLCCIANEYQNALATDKIQAKAIVINGEAPDENNDKIKTLEERVAVLEKEVVNKQMAISKRDEKLSQIEDNSKLIKKLLKENEELKQELDILSEINSAEENSLDASSDINFDEAKIILADYLSNHTAVFFGGHDSLASKLEGCLPGVRFISCEQISTLDNIVKKADCVFVKADHIAHKQMFKISTLARKSGTPIVYTPNSTNVEIIAKGLASNIGKILKEN